MTNGTPYNSDGETVDVVDADDHESEPAREEYDERYHDPEWLYQQYHGLGKDAYQIAEECGVGDTTIYNWMKRHGIERRSLSEAKRLDGPFTDADWLREQYHEKKKSTRQIAEECGVIQGTIRDWMDRHGIESRSISEAKLNQYADTVLVTDVDESPLEAAPERKTVEVGNRRYEGPLTGLDATESSIGDRNVEVIESPWRDGEWLREQYHGLGKSISQIAEECGVSDRTIRRWMDRHDIERRSMSEAKRSDGLYTDADWLREQYHEKENSMRQIAEECGVGGTTIRRWMDRHGIERRATSGGKRLNGPFTDGDWLREQYHEKEKSALQIAEECGVGDTTIYNWMERHDIERRSLSKAHHVSSEGEQ